MNWSLPQKHSSAACNSATEWDAELDRMVAAAGDSGELILPPPPPPQMTVTDRSHCEFYQGWGNSHTRHWRILRD